MSDEIFQLTPQDVRTHDFARAAPPVTARQTHRDRVPVHRAARVPRVHVDVAAGERDEAVAAPVVRVELCADGAKPCHREVVELRRGVGCEARVSGRGGGGRAELDEIPALHSYKL